MLYKAKKDVLILNRAKFCVWVAERMITRTNQLIDKQDGWFDKDQVYHLEECQNMVYVSKEVISDFRKFKQTTAEKAEQITNWWTIYGTVPEVT